MNTEAAFVVPRDNNELVKQYGGFVARLLRRYDSVGRHTMDLNQDIWMLLFASDVLTKFWTSLSKPAPTMTGKQAAAYCDVRFPTFCTPFYVLKLRGRGGWFPTPVKGHYSNRQAIWRTRDILKLRDSDRFKTRSRQHPDEPLPELPTSDSTPTRGRFESYLTMAIHNHFANFCRSKERKDKDIYLAPAEDGSPWVSGISDVGESPDECAEVRIAMSKLGSSGQEILSLLDQGYSLADACFRADVSISKVRMIIGR